MILVLLHRLKLISPRATRLIVLKQLDESVVGHVLDLALALQLDIVFILLVLFVEGLLLNGSAMGIRMHIVHVWEAHLPFFALLAFSWHRT